MTYHNKEIVLVVAFATLALDGITVGQFATDNVAENLKVAMRMSREAGLRSDTIFIEYTDRPKAFISRIIPVGKAEGMISVEPAVVSVATSGRRTMGYLSGRHGGKLSCEGSGLCVK